MMCDFQLYHATFGGFQAFKPGTCWPQASVCLISRIDFVHNMLMCMYMYVSAPEASNNYNGIMWWDMDPVWLVKQVVQLMLFKTIIPLKN